MLGDTHPSAAMSTRSTPSVSLVIRCPVQCERGRRRI